jgi:hypothetical protein
MGARFRLSRGAGRGGRRSATAVDRCDEFLRGEPLLAGNRRFTWWYPWAMLPGRLSSAMVFVVIGQLSHVHLPQRATLLGA